MLDTRWELAEDRYAIGLSADTADQFQGFHSPNMFIIVDEAEGVSDEIYEAIEAVMTSAAPRLLLIGNPTGIDGAFRRAFYEERAIYYTMTISALDSPNLIAGEVVIPGLATADWVEERRLAWGEEDPIFRSRILGEFSENSDDTLIRLSDIEAAARRQLLGPAEYALPDHPGQEEVVMAVDVARFGSDRSVILYRRGNRVEDICTFRKLDTMQFAARIAARNQATRSGTGVHRRNRSRGRSCRPLEGAGLSGPGGKRGPPRKTGRPVHKPEGGRVLAAAGVVRVGGHCHPQRQ